MCAIAIFAQGQVLSPVFLLMFLLMLCIFFTGVVVGATGMYLTLNWRRVYEVRDVSTMSQTTHLNKHKHQPVCNYQGEVMVGNSRLMVADSEGVHVSSDPNVQFEFLNQRMKENKRTHAFHRHSIA